MCTKFFEAKNFSNYSMWKGERESGPQLTCTLNTLQGRVLDYADKDLRSNISVLLEIMAMILVTSCEYECFFSILRLIRHH